jgi:SAM-dependent methyltransferase
MTNAVDISRDVLEIAQKGIYSLESPELVDEPIFERMTQREMQEMFDREDDQVKIKSWIKEGINWHCGDAGDPGIVDVLGPQDLVVANRFLCHMVPAEAEKCLRNIARLVKPGGHLFVSGIDLDVRTRIAIDMNWEPLRDSIEAIHDGDPTLRVDWPFAYWGLEPFNKNHPDWNIRYASVFRIGDQ